MATAANGNTMILHPGQKLTVSGDSAASALITVSKYGNALQSNFITGEQEIDIGPFAMECDVSITTGAGNITQSIAFSAESVSNIVTRVDSFYEAGDPSDSPMLARAVTAAGVNGALAFTPGKTYRYDRALVPLAGQAFSFNNATMKRIDKIEVTLAASIASGSSSFVLTVDDVSALYVGLEMELYSVSWAAAAAADGYTGNTQVAFAEQSTIAYRITSINTANKRVTLSGHVLQNNYAIGDKLISCCIMMLGETVPDVTIRNLIIDGNKDSYASTFNSWIDHCEIRVDGDRCSIDRVVVHDTICEGMIIGGIDSSITNCFGYNTQGNLFHLTSADGTVVGGALIDNCYGQANSIGPALGLTGIHQAGMITISANVTNFTIRRCTANGLDWATGTISATPKFLGNINGNLHGTRNIVVDDCYISNCGTGASAARLYNAFDFSTSGTDNIYGVTIHNTKIIDSGNFNMSENTGTYVFTNVHIDGLYIEKGQFRANAVENFNFNNIRVENAGNVGKSAFQYGVLRRGKIGYTYSNNGALTAAAAVNFAGPCTDVVMEGGLHINGLQIIRFEAAAIGTRCTLKGVSTRQVTGVTPVNSFGFVMASYGWTFDSCEAQSNIVSGGSTTGVLVTGNNAAAVGNPNILKNFMVRMGDATRSSINVSGATVKNTQIINCLTTKAVDDTGTGSNKVNNTVMTAYAP